MGDDVTQTDSQTNYGKRHNIRGTHTTIASLYSEFMKTKQLDSSILKQIRWIKSQYVALLHAGNYQNELQQHQRP